MAITKYFLQPAPSPGDKNRYKLSTVSSENDIKNLAQKLSVINSEPFPLTDNQYQWAIYLYCVSDEMKNKLKEQLNKIVVKKTMIAAGGMSATKLRGVTESVAGDKKVKYRSNLNPKYTFDNFVVGSSTRFTYAACQSVAENPGKNYNPLYIYGGVGLGKTHLMHAIGNYVKNKYSDYIELYSSTDQFTSEVLEAIELGNLKELKDKYKKIDILLMDDIQFLEQSEATQEEFFHIFNAMHSIGKQIIITSDKPPKKLIILEERLKSRFEWGLTTDVQSPNLETRKIILKSKSLKIGLKLSEEILNYISEQLTSNIRELEGIINRIFAYKDFSIDAITLKLVKDIIKNILPVEENIEKVKKTQVQKPPAADIPPGATPITTRSFGTDIPSAGFTVPGQTSFPTAAPLEKRCVKCASPLTYVPLYQKWFCQICQMYDTVIPPFTPQYPSVANIPPPQYEEKSCSACSAVLRYISKHERYYCDNCKKYEPITKEKIIEPIETPPLEQKKTKIIQPKEKTREEAPENFKNKIIGEKKENIREIKTGYFLPEGADKIFSNIVVKLDKLAAQKKFNFYIKPFFAQYYISNMNINFDKIAYIAKTNNIDIALCLEPDMKSEITLEIFKKKIRESMEKEEMPYELLPQSEIRESDALNLMLDIAICAKKIK